MKVIQILPELNTGGVERGTLEVGKYLIDQGHESIVISNGGRLVTQLEAEGSRHISLPVHKKRLSSLKQVKALRRLFEEERPDILHLRSRLPAWLAYLAWRKMAPTTRPQLVTTVHGFYSVNAYSAIMTKGERVICVSNSVKDYVLQNYPKVSEDCLTVIHRGVDPADFPHGYQPPADWLAKWKATYPQLKGKFVITLPGRITRLKGHQDLVEIITKLQAQPDIHGLVVGGASPKKASYLAEIQNLIGEAGLNDRITFTGHRGDMKNVLAVSDAVLSLTQQPESFGRTTLESLCLGTPVIGYNYGGVGEILEAIFPEGAVEVGYSAEAAKKILAWSKENPRVAPVQRFQLNVMLAQTLGCYKQLLANK
jgi:glycosyltransferase involved in cell wall biosynthesis